MKFAPIFFVFCLFIASAIGADNIKCYECKSATNKKCIDSPKEVNKVECRSSKTCAKYTMTGPTGVLVERGCSESLTWDKICYTAGVNASYNAMQISYETCNSNKCNSSSRLTTGFFVIFVGFLMIFAKNV
ncbi:uncharacterized protein LOC134835051 [Culicoides brevitarsis]|uniref:uncharacterized protein LOC134835051 n=1 Tax=Culicoides brevitarsis TaxID=469753 RepID=UPI00307B795F